MSNFGFDEDNIVNKFLYLQRSRYLSDADKERLEQFMDSYHSAKMDFIRQIQIISEIELTKRIKDLEESVLEEAL